MKTTGPEKALIIGGGISGRAATRLLLKLGAQVTIADDKALSGAEYNDLVQHGVKLLSTKEAEALVSSFDRFIVSPGVSTEHPLYQKASARKQVLSEIDLARPYLSGKLLAVTGTNGKSTTCAMTAHLLKKLGLHAIAAGNIGEPPCDFLARGETYEAVVLELSSYQLEQSQSLTPDVAIFNNFSFDHQERHKTMANYFKAKWRLFEKMKRHQLILVSNDVLALAKTYGCSLPANAQVVVLRTAYDEAPPVDSGFLTYQLSADSVLTFPNAEQKLDLSSFNLSFHNVLNGVFASLAAAHLCEGAFAEIFAHLQAYQALPFRFETVAMNNGFVIINDSKATNVDATLAALKCLKKPAILLLGGIGKGESFLPLLKFKDRIQNVICFGKSGESIFKELSPHFPCQLKPTLRECMNILSEDIQHKGTDILFSPGCASFDEFKNFEDRGHFFTNAVKHMLLSR